MRRRKTARGPAKRRRRTVTHGARKPSITRESAASLRAQLNLRTREREEAIEQLTASSKVLEVISRSAFDLQLVFETVAESAVRLCGADRAFIFRFDGEMLRCVVAYNAPSALEEFVRSNPIRPDRSSAAGRAAYERRVRDQRL
jgi:two-component system, NtrC family, sensor kinase